MRKFFVLSLLLIFGAGVTLAQEAKIGGVNISVGYESFPGKYYYVEEIAVYENGSITKSKVAQGEGEYSTGLLSLRVSKMTPVIMENLSAGIEVGASLPISGLDKSWEKPANDGTYTGTITGLSTGLSLNFKQTDKVEMRVSIFPILGKISYGIDSGNMKINLGIGLGAYVIHINQKWTDIRTYVQDSGGDEKAGDEIIDIWEWNYSIVSPGGEVNLGVSQTISENLSIGAIGRLGMITKGKGVFSGEDTMYYQIDWTPADKKLTTIKQGDEFGGISFGLGLALNLSF